MKRLKSKIALFAFTAFVALGSLLGQKAFCFSPDNITFGSYIPILPSEFESKGFTLIQNINDSRYKVLYASYRNEIYIDTLDNSVCIIYGTGSKYYDTNKTYLELHTNDFSFSSDSKMSTIWDFNSSTIINSGLVKNLDFINNDTCFNYRNSNGEFTNVTNLDIPFNSSSLGLNFYEYSKNNNQWLKRGVISFPIQSDSNFYLGSIFGIFGQVSYTSQGRVSTYLSDMLDNPPVQAPTINVTFDTTRQGVLNWKVNGIVQQPVPWKGGQSFSTDTYRNSQGEQVAFEENQYYRIEYVPSFGDYQSITKTYQFKNGANDITINLSDFKELKHVEVSSSQLGVKLTYVETGQTITGGRLEFEAPVGTEFTIRAELNGYITREQKYKVKESDNIFISPLLYPVAEEIQINLHSNVRGVFIVEDLTNNKTYTLNGTTSVIKFVRGTKFKVTNKASGYISQTSEVLEVPIDSTGTPISVEFELKQDVENAVKITLDVTPKGYSVSVNTLIPSDLIYIDTHGSYILVKPNASGSIYLDKGGYNVVTIYFNDVKEPYTITQELTKLDNSQGDLTAFDVLLDSFFSGMSHVGNIEIFPGLKIVYLAYISIILGVVSFLFGLLNRK